MATPKQLIELKIAEKVTAIQQINEVLDILDKQGYFKKNILLPEYVDEILTQARWRLSKEKMKLVKLLEVSN